VFRPRLWAPLSLHTESKVFGALREIATDGCYSRQIGGKSLRWQGKAGFIGCVTEAVDELGMGALGERFLLYRMPVMDEEDDLKAGSLALAVDRRSHRELRQVVCAFVEDLHVPEKTLTLHDEDPDRFDTLGPLRRTVSLDGDLGHTTCRHGG
jgi:hypothetical protein